MKTYNLYFEANDGQVVLKASGLSKEQADKMAEMEVALSIDPPNGKYVVREEN